LLLGRRITEEVGQTQRSDPQKFVHKYARGRKVGVTTEMTSSTCKYCSEEIFWKQSAKSDKWYAVDSEADKTSFHSYTCTGREAA